MKKLSATGLSKKLGKTTREITSELVAQRLIINKGKRWHLTVAGKHYGGEVVMGSPKGEYLVWPPDFNPFILKERGSNGLLNATKIGKKFQLSSQMINLIFTEIGWTEKALKGWALTSLGKKVGGVQFEHPSGKTYILWPKEICKNKSLLRSIETVDSSEPVQKETVEQEASINDFRKKFPANHRTKDGHQVRSRAEVIIDNALYDYGLVHAYERKLPVEEDVYTDFYIPSKNGGKPVYIEFWGLENDPKYSKRKQIKKNIYAKYDLNLIEICDQHIESLDDHLPRMLLKVGIQVE